MRKPHRFFYFFYVVKVVAFVVVSAQLSDSPAESNARVAGNQPIDVGKTNKSENNLYSNSLDKQFFTKLFIRKRKEQIAHVAHLKRMEKYERQYKIIHAMVETMFDIADSKKVLLENMSEADIKNISFSSVDKEDDVRDAVSIVLENIALFGDIVLNLPDITHRILKKQPDWNSAIRWSFSFLNRTKFLLDNATLEMVDLALQELNIVERKPDYFNANKIQFNSGKSEKSKKKEKRKRGPVLTKVEL